MPSYIVKNDIVHVYPLDPKCAAGIIPINHGGKYDTLRIVDASARTRAGNTGVRVHYPFRCVRCIPIS